MAKTTLMAASLATFFIYNVLAATNISYRSVASCGYVGGRIYCYGGDTSRNVDMISVIDENIYSLDIHAFEGKKSYTMSKWWNKIVPAVDFDTENREMPSSIVLSDGKRFMIQGGFNTDSSSYINQTIIYDTSSNTWTKGTQFTNEKGAAKQISSSTAITLPDNSIGFYGGNTQFIRSSENITYTESIGVNKGFHRFTMLVVGSVFKRLRLILARVKYTISEVNILILK